MTIKDFIVDIGAPATLARRLGLDGAGAAVVARASIFRGGGRNVDGSGGGRAARRVPAAADGVPPRDVAWSHAFRAGPKGRPGSMGW